MKVTLTPEEVTLLRLVLLKESVDPRPLAPPAVLEDLHRVLLAA